MENKTLALDALVIAIIIIGGVLIYRTLPTENKPITATATSTPMLEDTTVNSNTTNNGGNTPPPAETLAAAGAAPIDTASSSASSTPPAESAGKTTVVNGVKIEVMKAGSGRAAAKGDSVAVHYAGALTDGKVFDSSIPRGQPLTLTLGSGQVIQGWEIGILGMQVGEERRLTIPGNMAYGETGYPGVIPPNATLIFDVQLVAIK